MVQLPNASASCHLIGFVLRDERSGAENIGGSVPLGCGGALMCASNLSKNMKTDLTVCTAYRGFFSISHLVRPPDKDKVDSDLDLQNGSKAQRDVL